jgi:hypothetical protein
MKGEFQKERQKVWAHEIQVTSSAYVALGNSIFQTALSLSFFCLCSTWSLSHHFPNILETSLITGEDEAHEVDENNRNRRI